MKGVGLTDSAAKHIRKCLDRRGKGIGIRFGVRTSGCSGMAYALEYADATLPADLVFEHFGIQVIVDPKSLPYIDGTTIDHVRMGLNEGFKFVNPNEKNACGCGESFNV